MKKRCAVLLAAFFLWNTVVPCSYGGELMPKQEEENLQSVQEEAGERTPALSQEQVVVCNNAYDAENPCSPMVYITKLTLLGAGLTLRVYDSADGETRILLGSYEVEDTRHGFTVGIPLQGLSPSGGSVYVSMQQSGLLESQPVRAAYGKQVSPSGELRVIKANESVPYNTTSFASTPPLLNPTGIHQGLYYVVDVKLKDFYTVGGATIPVRYNTNYLELVPITGSTKKIETESRVDAPEGEPFGFTRVGNYKVALQCGVLPGINTDYGTAVGGDSYPNPPAGDPGEYPYVNTTTGLVKLEVTKNRYGPFDYDIGEGKHTGSGAGEKSVARLVFRAVADGTAEVNGAVLQEMSDLVHFASAADYEAVGGIVGIDGKPDDAKEAAKYYATQHPAGLSVSLEDAQLLRTPLSVKPVSGDFSPENPMILKPEEVPLLPESFEVKTAELSLPYNSIKVYNYTNAQSMASGLDANLQDRLVLSPSQETGGVIAGDLIRVYGDSGLGTLLGDGIADSEGAVSVELGNRLNEAGGKVYVTSTRGGVGSSAVAFSYPAEANREIAIRIYRTSLPPGVAEGADPQKNPEALGQVKKGEQFQLRVYVNDVNDLMGYTLPIHFNTQTVQAADRYFRPITKDGYLSEADFFNGRTPFSVGADISPLTMNELIIYYAEESEIPGLMEQMGIPTREEWDRRKRDIGVKIDYGVSGGEGVWNGGLLFTGPRDEATVYPYVDNNVSVPNAAHDGLVKLWTTSLTSPVERLSREGGYHFLTMNFKGMTNVVGEGAGFRFANARDSVYDQANPQGGRLCLSGPEESAGRNVNVKWEVYSMEELPIPSGTTVGGIVRSGSPNKETVITITQGGEPVSMTTVGGLDVGGGQIQQPFTLEDLMPGTYTVRFHKEAHVDVVLDNLKVEESPVDLTQSADPRVQTISLPCGDVNRDGNVGFLDRQMILLSGYYGKEIGLLAPSEQAEAFRLDLDGDGFVKHKDLQILMAAMNYGKNTVYINMGE